jgi:subtilisin-like proprotein convertase family protein
VVKRTFDAPIPDLQTVSFDLAVAESAAVETLAVDVELKHTYIGDLVITLQPPATTGVAAIVLHNRAGGSRKDLKVRYDAATTPALARFAGKSCKGTWTLNVKDAAAQDSGTLVSFGLALSMVHPDRVAPAAPASTAMPKAAPRRAAGRRPPARKSAAKKAYPKKKRA